MEKLNQPPFAGLKSVDRLLEIYSQTYLELQPNQIVELSHFKNFEINWNQIFEDKSFEAFHPLNNERTLRYTCQLEAPNEVKTLLENIEQAEFSNGYTQKLMAQTAKIVAVDILEG